jgi:septum formation topological specificity factor MinE
MINKMIHKIAIFALIALFLPIGIQAQYKVLDKSKKKKPDWVNATIEDFIIVTGNGKTIDEAKEQVIPKVREEIMNSVAVYVKSKSEMTIENENRNNIINTIERFKNTSTVETADIPSLKGLSLNKVSDYYWEKLRDKVSKEITVAYHVKYPFSKLELQKILDEFNKKEQEMTNKLNAIVDHIDDIKSLEEINTKIKQLKTLEDYFIDNRKEKAQLGITQLQDMLKSVEIVPIENDLGTLKYGMKIGQKFYETSQKPKYKNSECVVVTSRTSEGHEQIIKYTYEDCMEDEKNYIEVKYRFGNHKPEKRFYFDVTSNKVKIFLRGEVNMKASDKDDDNVNSYKVDMTLVSKYDAAFVIDKVVLNWPNMSPVTIENINKEFSGKGVHSFVFDVSEAIDLRKSSSKNKPEIDGTIFYKAKATGEKQRYKFYMQTIMTDW